MKWIMILIVLFASFIYCEYDYICDFRKRRSVEYFIQMCCSRKHPQSECYLEEWCAGDINFYVIIKDGDDEKRIPLDEFIDECQCAECCE
jgi:hypothetical protein